MALPGFARKPKLQQFFLVILVSALFLPFIAKAYHVDDPLYLWIARHIMQHPFDFFGFSANWYGTLQQMATISNNPPLFPYYLAAIGAILGWQEPAMHLAQLVPAIMVVTGTYKLAGRMQADPFLSALLAVVTPTYLLCGTSVMVDMTMTAFYVWALYFWLTGLDTGAKNSVALMVAAMLTVAAGLTKYFALSLLPLMAIVPIWQRIPPRRWLFFLLLPLVFIGLYQWWTIHLYGFGHVSEASKYADAVREKNYVNSFKSFLYTLSFTGGGLLIPVAFAPLLLSKRSTLLSGVAASGVAILLWQSSSLYPQSITHSWTGAVQVIVFTVGGLAVLVATAVQFLRQRDAWSFMLLCWIFGAFIFNTVMTPFIAGRYLLPLVPAVAIVFAKSAANLTGWRRYGIGTALVCLLGLGLLTAVADYKYANEVRSVTKGIELEWHKNGGQLYFLGHWGAQYYLEQAGGVAVDKYRPQPKSGDMVLVPEFGSNIKILDLTSYSPYQQFRLSSTSWLSTFDPALGAGFHSSTAGPLPFAFGNVSQDRFYLYKVL